LIQTDGSTSLTQMANEYFLYAAGGASGPSLNYGGSPVTVGEFGNIAPIGAVKTASGYDIAWEIPSTNQFTFWAVDNNGNYLSNMTGLVAGTDPTLKSLEATFYQDFNGDGFIDTPTTVINVSGHVLLPLSTVAQPAAIGAGATLELTGADSSSVTFEGSTGELVLDHSSLFTGEFFNFTGNGSPSGSDQLDLRDIAFGTGTTESFSGNTSGGMLTIKDSEGDTAHIQLSGNYTNSTFTLSSDGHGGTLVIDPPTTPEHFAWSSFVFRDLASAGAAPTKASGWTAEAIGANGDHWLGFYAEAAASLSSPSINNDHGDGRFDYENNRLENLHLANLQDHHFIIA
jgi:hypothetical protein